MRIERFDDLLEDFRFFRYTLWLHLWIPVFCLSIVHKGFLLGFKSAYITGEAMTDDEKYKTAESQKELIWVKIEAKQRWYEYRFFCLSHNRKRNLEKLYNSFKKSGLELDITEMEACLSPDLKESFIKLRRYIRSVAMIQRPGLSHWFK